MLKRSPISLCLTTALSSATFAGCASPPAGTIPPASASEVEGRQAPPVEPDARTPRGVPGGAADPEGREALINAGGPDASSPGGPHPQPGSTAGGTGDTRGLVRSGSPN